MQPPKELGFGSGMTCWRRLWDWNEAGVWQQRLDPRTTAGQAYATIVALVAARRDDAFDAHAPVTTIAIDQPAVLAIRRGERFVAVFNFSGTEQYVDWHHLQADEGWTTLLRTAEDGALENIGVLPAWSMVWRKKT